MDTPGRPSQTTYTSAGVDIDKVDVGLQRLISRVRETWPRHGAIGAVKLDIGYYANVIDLGGQGLAITTDGVGTKVLIAQLMAKYDTIGIDCVAMNVNDLLCVGATPVSMVDYLAVEEPDTELIDEISVGLCEGAKQANVSICGGEIAQLREILTGPGAGRAFDLAGTAVGIVALDRIITGSDLVDGDVLLGIESNGVHSNGLTLARQVLFQRNQYSVDSVLPGLSCTLGEELLKPTHIYVPEVLALLEQGVSVKALAHITGDGLLNLTRVSSDVGYVIDNLPPVPPIFSLIQEHGNIPDEEMFRVFNMGIGFCIVVPGNEVGRARSIVESHGTRVYELGHVVADDERRIFIKQKSLVGSGKEFRRPP
jgi:phosphoribosylformylglycinamidine cyclo-ligase